MFRFSYQQSSLLIFPILFVTLFLSSCSQSTIVSNQKSNSSQQVTTNDALENFNRDVFEFNTSLDKLIFKPIAVTYKKATPEIIDTGISNIFDNLDDVGNAVNNLLQFKPGEALIDVERVLFNTSVGLGGVFDVATSIGLEKYDEDFGQTLAVWGVDSGSYIMLPFFGPSTLRDATAKLTIDRLLDPANYTNDSLALFGIEYIDKRGDLLVEEDAFKDFANDEYIAIRDAWLQRREYLIKDGKVDDGAQSDMIDELEDLDDE